MDFINVLQVTKSLYLNSFYSPIRKVSHILSLLSSRHILDKTGSLSKNCFWVWNPQPFKVMHEYVLNSIPPLTLHACLHKQVCCGRSSVTLYPDRSYKL